jgi:hypothetical protein
MKSEIEFINCDAHENTAVILDGVMVSENDDSIQNVLKLAKHLGWEIISTTLSREDYERRFF